MFEAKWHAYKQFLDDETQEVESYAESEVDVGWEPSELSEEPTISFLCCARVFFLVNTAANTS